MKITALIPIKAHSERVKNKNFKEISGKPLYFYILNTLEKSDKIDEIIINTDSERIETDVAKRFSKVKIHRRPVDLQGDTVSVNKLIEYDLQNSEADVYIQTHTTNPLLSAATVEEALLQFAKLQPEYDSMFSVNRFQSRFYLHKKAVNHNPAELIPTQQLPPVFEENSLFYIFTQQSFRSAGQKRIGQHPFWFVTPKIESIDIDDEDDFAIATALISYFAQQ